MINIGGSDASSLARNSERRRLSFAAHLACLLRALLRQAVFRASIDVPARELLHGRTILPYENDLA
jgi:hypothetical protein